MRSVRLPTADPKTPRPATLSSAFASRLMVTASELTNSFITICPLSSMKRKSPRKSARTPPPISIMTPAGSGT